VNEHLNNRRFDTTATLACVGMLVLWAFGPNFIKYLTEYLDLWTQNFIRYCIACLFWLPFLALSIRRGRLDRSIWRRALPPAAANIVMQCLWAASFYYINPAFVVLLSKTSIIWIAAFSLLFFPQERPLIKSKRFWVGLGLCIIGVLGVLYYSEEFAAKGTMTGVALGLTCAFMWGVYTVTVKVAFRDFDSRSGFAVICIYTVLGLGVVAAIFGDVPACMDIGVRPWIVVVISAVLSIALAHVLYYTAIKRIGATIPALVILAQPFPVLAISYFAFGESFNAFQLVFGVILLIGAALAIWAQEHLREK